MARITFLVFPNFQLLDAAGPLAAFEVASGLLANPASSRTAAYRLEVRAQEPGLVQSSSGVNWLAKPLRVAATDTLVVAGGDGVDRAARCPRTLDYVRRMSGRVRRLASVCSGTYVLAAAGVLEGKVATTHWCRSTDFLKRFPGVKLEPDRLYVRDGSVWTSAGISAGIDLALALIAEDHGPELAKRVAQQLVLSERRAGKQSQFSPLLALDGSGRFQGFLQSLRSRLQDRLAVQELAASLGMSPRNFARAFRAEVGLSPAKAVERLRVDAARTALETDGRSVQEVALSCGFGDAERMRRAFHRVLGIVPRAVRKVGAGGVGSS